VSPIGRPAEVLRAPTSKGSGAERAMFECAVDAGPGIVVLPVGNNGDSSDARAPCTGHGSCMPEWDWTVG